MKKRRTLIGVLGGAVVLCCGLSTCAAIGSQRVTATPTAAPTVVVQLMDSATSEPTPAATETPTMPTAEPTQEPTAPATETPAEVAPTAEVAPVAAQRIQARAGYDAVNVRAEPNTDAAIAGQLRAGEAADQVGVSPDGTWVQVKIGAVAGWIRADLVESYTGAPASDVATSLPVATESPAVVAATSLPVATQAPAANTNTGRVFPAVGEACPPEAPIKGNINSKGEKIYHSPGQQAYERTIPEACYATGADAEQDGFRPAQR